MQGEKKKSRKLAPCWGDVSRAYCVRQAGTWRELHSVETKNTQNPSWLLEAPILAAAGPPNCWYPGSPTGLLASGNVMDLWEPWGTTGSLGGGGSSWSYWESQGPLGEPQGACGGRSLVNLGNALLCRGPSEAGLACISVAAQDSCQLSPTPPHPRPQGGHKSIESSLWDLITVFKYLKGCHLEKR